MLEYSARRVRLTRNRREARTNGFVELVLVNSHDAGCAYQLHAGIYRRICSNGLVVSNGSFTAIRFRHTGLLGGEIVQASLRLLNSILSANERDQFCRGPAAASSLIVSA